MKKINNILKGVRSSPQYFIYCWTLPDSDPRADGGRDLQSSIRVDLIGAGIYHIYIYIRGKAKATIMDLLRVWLFLCWGVPFMTPSIVIKLLPWMLSAFVLG